MPATPKSYHEITSYDRHAMEPHALDWAGQPMPYKIYSKDETSVMDTVVLPDIEMLPEISLEDTYRLSLKGRGKEKAAPSFETLSKICLLAGGLTARSRQGNGYFYFRSAPSAGALYPNELYFAAFDIDTLDPGIYHYGPHNRSLTRIRNGNFKAFLMSAIPQLVPDSAGVFFITGIFFRSAWKYRKRAYRYLLLDGGHLAENLRLAVCAAGYACRLHHEFNDEQVDALLGVDASREGTLCCVGIFGGENPPSGVQPAVDPLPPRVPSASRVSDSEMVYPEITAIHEAAKLVANDEAKSVSVADKLGINPTRDAFSMSSQPEDGAMLDYAQTIMQRRSKRNFISASMGQQALDRLLWMLCRASGEEAHEIPEVSACVSVGFLVGNVQDRDPGFYLLNPQAETAGRVFSGNVMEKMASVCLDQAWLKNAAVHFVFMTNLEMVNEKWGARGYRYAVLTAGRLGHAVYLGATALGLGCCGIGAFYDKEARKVLRMNEASAMLYLVGVGKVRG